MTKAAAATSSRRPEAVLGIDLGTSSVKALVTDIDGNVIGHAVGHYSVSTPQPGRSETDPQEWLAATLPAVRHAVAQAQAEPVAVGLSGQMHGVVATSQDGHPLRPAMLWSDARAIEQLAIYRQLPDGLRARLANPLSPGMAGPLLTWLIQHEPDTYATMRWALQPKDWLRAQLTGQFATEPSDASATLLYDVPGDTWDAELLEALGLDAERLPPVLPTSAQEAGQLSRTAAESLGLRPGIPVAAGAADTAAAALGSGLVDPNTVQLTIGTGAQIVRPVRELPTTLDSNPVTHLYRAATDSGWYAMGAVLNGGSTLAWVLRVLDATWQELYAAAALEPRGDDPYFLPHLHGERTPYLDPRMRGAWSNLDPRHQREDLLRAALEGVAFAVLDALGHIVSADEGIPVLRLAGGGTTDPGWRQMLADVLRHPVSAVDVPAASGLGAAALGARAAGLIDEAAVVAQRAPTSQQPVAPHAGRAQLYRERHEAFQRLVAVLRSSSQPVSSSSRGPPTLGDTPEQPGHPTSAPPERRGRGAPEPRPPPRLRHHSQGAADDATCAASQQPRVLRIHTEGR
jgi:xylulokinase